LPAAKGKGLEISGTFSRKNGQVLMELTLTNRALQPMSGFAIQFNKNRFLVLCIHVTWHALTHNCFKGHFAYLLWLVHGPPKGSKQLHAQVVYSNLK